VRNQQRNREGRLQFSNEGKLTIKGSYDGGLLSFSGGQASENAAFEVELESFTSDQCEVGLGDGLSSIRRAIPDCTPMLRPVAKAKTSSTAVSRLTGEAE
jgi:hypothetical protein